MAEFYQTAGDEQRARPLLDRVEREAPDTGEAWYLRSFATLDRPRALHCVQEALDREPSHVLAWHRLAWLRLHTGDVDGALAAADKLVTLGEDIGNWTRFKADDLVRSERFREAIELYSRLGHYDARAQVYRRVKEYEKAVADYTRVLERAGESAGVVWHYYQRATPLWILGRTDEALADYRRVRIVRGRPGFYDARSFLILHERGREGEAEALLKTALREVQEHWLRQVFRCLAGDLSPEELVADALARNSPEQLCEAYYYAGEVCLLTGHLAEAGTWFARCVGTGVALDPDAALETP